MLTAMLISYRDEYNYLSQKNSQTNIQVNNSKVFGKYDLNKFEQKLFLHLKSSLIQFFDEFCNLLNTK